MAENSKIEWTDHTFNPWTGCTKVSPGCDHCYAEGWAKRSGTVRWGAGEPRRRTTEANRRCAAIARKSGRWINIAGGHGFNGERVHYAERVGKKAAGRLLDGVQHDGFPA